MPIEDEKKLMEIMGKRLLKARTAAKMSRDDVFLRTGIRGQTIMFWEQGRKQAGAISLAAVCEVIGVDIGDIVPTNVG